MLKGRQQAITHCQRRTDMDSARNHIITALTHINMVVCTNRQATLLGRQGSENLIYIHISASTRPRLKHVYGELIATLTG